MKKKKWLSYTIDGILIALIGFFGYVQVSMLVTKSGNHGVPMAFGCSFLYISTDSMDNADRPGDLGQGSGIIIQKVDPASLKTSTPILDEEGNVKDYQLDGDIVTFYWKKIANPDTHRLIDKQFDEVTGKYMFRTMGDNPKNHQAKQYEEWGEDVFIGKVISDSKAFGSLLTMISPDVAAQQGKTAWLLPVAVLVPLAILAILSVVDVFRVAKQKQAYEDEQIRLAMEKAGIDINDEVAVETFRAKEEYKMEYRAKLAEEVQKAKKAARKELEKSQKRGGTPT